MHRLPAELRAALEHAASNTRGLAEAAAGLSEDYRQPRRDNRRFVRSAARRNAYLTTRLPATFAAVCAALDELRARGPQAQIASLLDLGAGPGTALWAAGEILPALQRATLIEADADFIAAGRELAQHSTREAVRRAVWEQSDLRAAHALPPRDLVVISYALNELDAPAQTALIQRAWPAAAQFLVIVEPGTKQGFANILQARELLLSLGANIAAPCPHAGACPLAAQEDWCHFAQRLERTAQHRRAKSGELGYEDEKFSYLIASRQPAEPAPARILRHPLKLKGHVKLSLCAPEGLRQQVVTAKIKEDYKNARKAAWGDGWK
jgi:ribosomal protein RSM22 (predicted rRNA methylase)